MALELTTTPLSPSWLVGVQADSTAMAKAEKRPFLRRISNDPSLPGAGSTHKIRGRQPSRKGALSVNPDGGAVMDGPCPGLSGVAMGTIRAKPVAGCRLPYCNQRPAADR
jgi:hypothetical protein